MNSGLSQHEVLKNEFSVPCWKRRAADLTSDSAMFAFRSGFYFDNFVERIAVRAKVKWLVGRHKTAPAPNVVSACRVIVARRCAYLKGRRKKTAPRIRGRQSEGRAMDTRSPVSCTPVQRLRPAHRCCGSASRAISTLVACWKLTRRGGHTVPDRKSV